MPGAVEACRAGPSDARNIWRFVPTTTWNATRPMISRKRSTWPTGASSNVPLVMTPLAGFLNSPMSLRSSASHASTPMPGRTVPDKPAAIGSLASPRSLRIGPPGNSSPTSAVAGRSQSPPSGHPLCQGRQPRPEPLRTGEQCDLHQHRARHHHSSNLVWQFRFRHSALLAGTQGRLHRPAVSLSADSTSCLAR